MRSSSRSHDIARLWPLVGRSRESGQCAAALADPLCGGILLRGEPGVGKTRLATHLWQQALDAGGSVVGGRATATEAAAAIPFGAIAHLLPAGLDLSDPLAAFQSAGRAFRTGSGSGSGSGYVLLIDDLHLLDSASATLVRQLLDSDAVFVMATLRSDVLLSDAVLALDRTDGVSHIDVGAFDHEGVEEVLTAVLGDVVERRTSYELHRYSRGNLLFLRELVLGLVDDKVLTHGDGLWRLAGTVGDARGTPRLRQLIGSRLGRVPAAAMTVLETLAVAEPIGLSELTGMSSPETVTLLEDADLIHLHQSRRRMSATLAHPLYGEVLRAAMPVSRRLAIVDGCAERVLSYGARRLEDTLRVATWTVRTTGTADPGLIVKAARLARHSHDYSHVVDLLKRLPEESRAHATRLQLGEAYYLLRRFDDSERVLKQAYDTAPDEAEAYRLVVERTQNLFWGAARAQQALEVNAQALTRTADPATRAALLANEGAMRAFSGQPVEGLRLLRDTGLLAEERVRLYADGMKALGLSAVGRTEEAVELARRTHALHVEAGGRIIIQHPSAALSVLSLACGAMGDLAGSRQAAEQGHRDAVADNATEPAAWLSYDMGRVAWLQGRVADARRWFAETLAIGLDEGMRLVLRPAAAGLAAAAAVLGQAEHAQTVVDDLDDLDAYPDVFFLPGEDAIGMGWSLASRGLVTAARQTFFDAAGRARAAGAVSSEMMLLTEAVRLGGAGRAVARMAVLERACDGAFVGPRTRFAQAMAGRDADALLSAAGDLERIGALLVAAEAAAAAKDLYQRAGQARQATSAANLAGELARCCQGASTPGLMGIEMQASLSAREREVAALAAAGVPSREIGAQLFVSTRTVDNHLQRVYAKLGITSRRDLANMIAPPPRPGPRP
ncbi:helix-turn-helix transcriptional regulator [Streptomyces sp. NBC_01262]|uniref:helix-turn-helix transcriptional regulator n=1 Tax=Streptomyces sp. NBC_01262 TaxID=2903803 RepID=UPI002E2F41EC|nr:LuxR C-terminal-related transcriptional regulator [Streptomyces sp. NBC_01262]